jgi:membrane associated rhomboid family serine protease
VKGVVGMEIDQCDVCEGIWFDHREWDYLGALRVWERHRREEEQPTTWGHWWFQLLLNLPVEFNIRPHQYALVTLSIIALCAVVYFVGGTQLASLLALWPNQLGSGIGVVELLTYQFVHVSPVHLFGNMYFLYIFGDNVEDVLGPGRFLLLYLACGVLAALVQSVAGLAPHTPLMGASGSVAGLMGAYLLLFRGARLTLMVIVKQFKAPAWVWIGLWVGIQLLGSWADPSGLRSHVAWLAHVGGFASGILLVWPFRRTLTERHALLHLLETGRLVA